MGMRREITKIRLVSLITKARNRILPVIFLGVFGLVGVGIYVASKAVAPAVSFHASQGSVSAPAAIVADTGSSTGQVVAFSGVADDPIIAAVGDIACSPEKRVGSSCRQQYTAELITARPNIDAVLVLGDIQYYCGSLWAFQNSYDKSWGAFKHKTKPAVGNHEYITDGAPDCTSANEGGAGYFDYFGSAAGTRGMGWYSWQLGDWKMIALNSQCGEAGGCSVSSEQYRWLESELSNSTAVCTLAYFHHPLFSQDTSGGRSSPSVKPFWELLYKYGADVVFVGHSHNYQAYPRLDPDGNPDDRGVLQIVSGAGGSNHTGMDPNITPKPFASDNTTFGIVRMTLHPTSFTWEFINDPGSGSYTHSASESCTTTRNF